ncbi:GPI-anchor transamidase-like protein [Nucleospora cyclopteri]
MNLLLLYSPAILTKNYILLCNTSKNFFNYRHSTNIKVFNHILKNYGFTDKEIVLLQTEDPIINPRNTIPKKIHLTEEQFIPYEYSRNCKLNLNVLLNYLYLRHPKLYQLNENDNLLVYICGHGNEDLFKIVDRYFLMKGDIERVICWLSKRLRKVMFILDTCQAEALIDRAICPKNVCILTTSKPNVFSYSTQNSRILGVYTVCDFIKTLYDTPFTDENMFLTEYFSPAHFKILSSELTISSSESFKLKDFFVADNKEEKVKKFIL